jgi:hypothetical protein
MYRKILCVALLMMVHSYLALFALADEIVQVNYVPEFQEEVETVSHLAPIPNVFQIDITQRNENQLKEMQRWIVNREMSYHQNIVAPLQLSANQKFEPQNDAIHNLNFQRKDKHKYKRRISVKSNKCLILARKGVDLPWVIPLRQ